MLRNRRAGAGGGGGGGGSAVQARDSLENVDGEVDMVNSNPGRPSATADNLHEPESTGA